MKKRLRQIIVPKNIYVEHQLDYDLADDCDLYILNLSQGNFNILCDIEFFNKVNDISPEILIDDFEDAHILEKEYLKEVIYLLNIVFTEEAKTIFILNDIKVMFEMALNNNVGVHFYF